MRFLSAAELFLWTTASSCLLFLVEKPQAFTTSIQAQRRLWQRPYLTDLKTNTRRSSSSRYRSPSSNLLMHMGHSHEHHQHHRHDNDNDRPHVSTANTRSMTTPRSRRRRLQVVIAMAASMLVQPLWKRSLPSSSHWLATVVASAFVYLAQPLAVDTMVRFRQWMHGISRHTPRYAPDSAADRVTLLGGVINLVLSASKMAVGIICHSSALMADAGHSLSDLFSDVVTLVAVSIGRLPPDEDHPFGHGKFEAIGSLFLSLILLGTGLGIGLLSNQKLVEIISLHRSGAALAASQTAAAVRLPGFPALIMAGISVVSKEWLFRVTRNVGERLQSTVVIANAWHHRSDAYTSVMAVASIALARYIPGLVFCDAAAGLLVAATIGMTGAEILGQSINELTDHRQIVAVAEASSSSSSSSLRNGEVVENWEVPSSLNDTVPEPIFDARPDTGMAHRRVVDGLIDQHSDYVTLQALRTTDQNHIHVFIESSTGDLSKLSGLTREIVAALEDRPDIVQANVYLDLKTTTTSSLPRSTSPTTAIIQSQFD